MTVTETTREAPEWFGSAARAIAFFPFLMGVYVIVYAAWWPFAWGLIGIVAFSLAAVFSVAVIGIGIRQVRHAATFPLYPSAANVRLDRQMGILNSVTHPLWILGVIALLLTGNGRFALPLVVFIIGAHFVPMAKILGRTIDYILGPLSMAFASVALVLAGNTTVSWLVVAGIAGVGGALSTAAYAVYMTRAYRRLCASAHVQTPVSFGV